VTKVYSQSHKSKTLKLSAFIALMIEAVRTSETSVYSETTWRYIPEGSNLHTRRRENLKSHEILWFSSVSPGKYWASTLKLRHNRFLPHPIKMTVHLSSSDSKLYSLSY
jgi:hypothetical protein